MYFTLDDVLANFDDNTYSRGAGLVHKDAVRKIALEKANLRSVVAGTGNRLYEQKISLGADKGSIKFKSECSCSAGRNCQHVVAALLAHLLQQEKSTGGGAQPLAQAALPNALVAWLQRLEGAAHPKPQLVLDPSQSA